MGKYQKKKQKYPHYINIVSLFANQIQSKKYEI